MNNNLSDQLKHALKSGDRTRVSVLRMLIAATHNAEIAKRGELTEPEFQAVVRKEIRKRHEAVEAYRQGKRDDLAKQEEFEAEILSEYLPRQLSDDDLSKVIDQVIAEIGPEKRDDCGNIIGQVMAKIKDRAEGKRVSEVVRSKLNGLG